MSKFTDSCAPSTPLQNLSTAYGQSNSKVRSGVERQIDHLLPSSSGGDALAQEFLAHKARQTNAPATFNMGAMLARRTPETSGKWADEFHRNYQRTAPPEQWAQEFARQHPFNMNQMARELPTQWADEFSSRNQQAVAPRAADEWARDFDSWLSGNQHLPAAPMDAAWSDAQTIQNDPTLTLGDKWAEEFSHQMMDNNMTDDLMEQEFDSLFKSGLNRFNYNPMDELAGEYEFSQTNPHLNEDSLMERATEQINSGNTQEAILYYEAAVQRNPQDSEAWCQLGLSHQENEHDVAAISAFRKCLEIDSAMRNALLGYSVSLANESYDNEALMQLEKWISVYKKSGAWNADDQTTRPTDLLHQSYIDPIRFEKVENHFLESARAQTNVDPELQNALGVLYNLNRNFSRAVDSIKAAIARNPENPRLWNRLGATLANSDRTAEAIEAYRHALTLFPAYVRARYNLGISCMHLSCYKEAAEHFLSALRLQKSADSSPIWSTLRSAIIRMNSADMPLMDALNTRDINGMQQALSKMTSTMA